MEIPKGLGPFMAKVLGATFVADTGGFHLIVGKPVAYQTIAKLVGNYYLTQDFRFKVVPDGTGSFQVHLDRTNRLLIVIDNRSEKSGKIIAIVTHSVVTEKSKLPPQFV